MTKIDELKARVYDTRVFYHPDAEAALRVSTIKVLIAAVEALDTFSRVAMIMEPLNLPDDTPLSQCAPGIWPTLGDCRKARAALAPFGE